MLGALGAIASMVGIISVRPTATPKDPMDELNKGFYVTAVLAIFALILATFWMLPYGKLEYLICGIIGIIPSSSSGSRSTTRAAATVP